MPDSARLREAPANRFVASTMPSLRQLLAAHAPLLLLDAASARTQVGWFPGDDPSAAQWATSTEESGIGVFRCIAQLGIDLGAARAFIFCDGPGSVLGIRTTAMALRTWTTLTPRPAYAFCSLAVVATNLGRDDLHVVADARRDLWHTFRLGGSLQRLPVAQLTGDLVMPENFRHWSTLPVGATSVPYSLADALPRIAHTDLFRPAPAPDAFLHEEPSYVTWTPQIHRAPVRS